MLQLGDLLDLDRRAQLDLVAGDGRAAGEAGDLRVDVELLEHAGDRLDDLVVRAAAGARSRARGQQIARRQRVGRVAGGLAHRQAQLLADTVTARLGRRGGRDGRAGRRGRAGGSPVAAGGPSGPPAARRSAAARRRRPAGGGSADAAPARPGGSSGPRSSPRSSSASCVARPRRRARGRCSRRNRSGTSRSGVSMSSRTAYPDRSSSTGTATQTVSPVASGMAAR